MLAVVWTVFSFKRNVLGTLTLRLILAPVGVLIGYIVSLWDKN